MEEKKKPCVGIREGMSFPGNVGFSRHKRVSIDLRANNDYFILRYPSYENDVIIYTEWPIHVCYVNNNFRCGWNNCH